MQFGRTKWMRGAAGAALAIGVSVATATLAEAACTPGAVDATTPAPGTTVTCDVTTLNQNPSSGYGTGIQTGITIDVLNGATVQGTGGTVGGIWVGAATIRNGVGASILGATDGIVAATGSLTVTNNGMIDGTTGTGISAATGVTLANQTGASISGGTNGVVSTAGAITVDNAGSITGTGQAAINASADVTVTNQASGAISGGTNGVISTAGAVTVDNAGSITGTGQAAIDATADVTVTNRDGGVISGGTRGIFSRGGNITLDNAGSITSTGGVATVSANLGSVKVINRAGASISGGIVATQAADVHNSGNIGSVTATSVKLVNTATGTIGSIGALGEIDINNFGTVTNDVVGNGSLVNHAGGRILGLVMVGFGGGGLSLVNHAGGYIGSVAANMSFDNSGTIGHVDLGGNAQLVNNAGASITGSATGVLGSFGSTASIVNAGTISGTNFAIEVFGGNTITNLAGGNILGGIGGVAAIFDVSITNSGNISGGAAPSYGIAVNGALQLVNNVGASISGSVYGIYAVGNASIVNAGSISGSRYGVATTAAGGSASIVNSGSISGGTAAIQFNAPGNTLTLAPGSVISGKVIGFGSDTLQLGGTGSGSFDISRLGLDPALQYVGFNTFNKVDSSLWSLTGTATYAGPVNVNGGTLAVNGNLASASLLTVNAGGILGGNGIVGVTAINGGTLAPGNSVGTLTVSGSLTLTAASTYLVQISGASSDRTNVTGTANIAGTVTVDPLTRVSATTTYTIMTGGTVNGSFTTVNFLSATNSFARNARLSYVGNDVLLTVDPGLLSPNLPGNANINQINVAAGIDNALLAGANMPAGFNGLFALTGSGLANALTQVSGETATGSQQATFDAMNLFMGLMTDPFTAGRGGNAPGTSGFAAEHNASAYAANGRKRSHAEREAYAMFTKAPPRAFEGRWNVWAAGFGGSQTTDGNATLGSNTATSRVGGVAVGADYWLSPQTVAGFALAGGGTNFSVNGVGSGRSDLFQAGAFVRHTIGSAYITAAAAYGWQDITTDRTVTVAGVDRLRAQFNANAFSGRVEGGNRYVLPSMGGIGLTPYAAAQATAFDLPAYAESVVSGADTFALAYGAKSVTATRSELGLRGDRSWAMPDSILTLRGRFAWAHDYNSDRSIGATFQTLPGASFVVNGAAQSPDKALTTASAEMKWRSGFSLAATFEGEFSDNSSSYAGKGVARYAW